MHINGEKSDEIEPIEKTTGAGGLPRVHSSDASRVEGPSAKVESNDTRDKNFGDDYSGVHCDEDVPDIIPSSRNPVQT